MDDFDKFYYYARTILTGLIGLGALVSFVLPIPDAGTWQTILLIVFVMMVFVNIILPKPNDALHAKVEDSASINNANIAVSNSGKQLSGMSEMATKLEVEDA